MTNQEAFDTAIRGLLAQGSLGWDSGGCRLRTDDGRKCAVGFLIPDGLYRDAMESAPLQDILHEVGLQPLSYVFLRDLQNLHDDAGNMETLIDNAHTFATKYGLSTAVLDQRPGVVEGT